MRAGLGLMIALAALAAPTGEALGGPEADGGAASRLYGIAFSPYEAGQSPDWKSPVGAEQIRRRLEIVAPHTGALRTYGMLDGLERIPAIARREFGLRVAAGVWLDRRHPEANEAAIAKLIASARRGEVDVAVIGNETLFFRRLAAAEEENEAALLEWIRRFRQAAPGVAVTTADNFDALKRHPRVMAACDRIFVHIHPYYMGVGVAEAVGRVAAHYREMQAASGGKPVVIAETGWPSCGAPRGAAVPDAGNARRYRRDFTAWAAREEAPYFYFAAFDEPWKAVEGTEGPCWGLWSSAGHPKP